MLKKSEISILIPVYNRCCYDEVVRLKTLCDAVGTLAYEVIVADDGSTDVAALEANSAIAQLENCRFVRLWRNRGAAATRNSLVRESRYKWLLFLDCDLTIPDDYIRNYAESGAEGVVCGGVRIESRSDSDRNCLRYMYEKKVEARRSLASRNAIAYKEFLSGNFLAPRDVMLRLPFNEKMRRYEDVVFGRVLCENNVAVEHIDNPLVMDSFEDNPQYMNKVDHNMRTLRQFRDDLRGYSYLLDFVERPANKPFVAALKALYALFGRSMRRNLSGGRPCLKLFNLYRAGYYLSLD